jgi:NTE family protein
MKVDKCLTMHSCDWARTAEGPSGPEIVMAAADTAIDSSVRSSFTAFDRTMSEWRDTLVRWRCGLSEAERTKHGTAVGWDCRDLKFFVGRVNFEQLGQKRATELSSSTSAVFLLSFTSRLTAKPRQSRQ